jgi:methyltransferase
MVGSLKLYLALLALVAVERLYELRLSNRNAAWAFARGATETGQRHYRVMTALHTSFLLCCALEPLVFNRPFQTPWGWLFLALSVSAQALRYWAISTLGPRWNTRIITIANAAPVTTGPYRFLRHPNYVAVVLELLALPMIHHAFLTAVLFSTLNALLLTVRIRSEEQALGVEYRAAFAAKSRLFPSFRRKP